MYPLTSPSVMVWDMNSAYVGEAVSLNRNNVLAVQDQQKEILQHA